MTTDKKTMTDDEIVKQAYEDTQELINKMKATLETYVKESTNFNHNTRFMVASRAMSAMSHMWMSNIYREFSNATTKLQAINKELEVKDANHN